MPPETPREAERSVARAAPWSQSGRFVPRVFVRPTLEFMSREAAGGGILLVAAVVALVWANSPAAASYERLWSTVLDIRLGGLLHLEHDLRGWVNEAAMVVFFLVVGLEIKRELVLGELRDVRTAMLPIVAAAGGMLVPAGVYLLVAGGGVGAGGWAIPMATDIAFAIGVVTLLGTRVPIGAKLFILTLAIVDDIGAIVVIAIFYSEGGSLGWLFTAVAAVAVTIGLQRINVRSTVVYVAIGVVLWLSLTHAGVHGTLAGVIMGLLTPTRSMYNTDRFVPVARRLVDEVAQLEARTPGPEEGVHGERVHSLLRDVDRLSRETVPPLDRLEHRLQPWSTMLVVPLFAVANAGVRLDLGALSLADPVFVGTALGLVVGKVVGVTVATWLGVRLGLGRLPSGTTWRHVVGLGLIAGIGFTVALFLTALSFDDPTLIASAKLGVLTASVVAGVLGYLWLRFETPPQPGGDPAQL